MSNKRYNTNENNLIWESFQNRTNHKKNTEVSNLIESDLKYIEQFLIDEGLMGAVKGAVGKAAGAVKDFAADKIMKPLMDMLAKAISSDPATADKLTGIQQAAQQGGDLAGALQQAGADMSVMDKVNAEPEAEATPQAESYHYQFQMNEMICDALVSEGIISRKHSQIIQEKYYNGAIGTLFTEANKPTECPWMPNLVVEKGPVRGPDGQFAAGNQSGVQFAPEASGGGSTPGEVAKQVIDLFAKARSSNKNFRPGKTFDALQKAYPAFGKYVASKGQSAEADKSAESGGDAVSASGGTPADGGEAAAPAAGAQAAAPAAGAQAAAPAAGAQAAAPAAPAPAAGAQAAAPAGESKGILSKAWSFVKKNKGAIGGLAAMGIAAALIAGGGPLAVPATRYLTGALIGGVRGAVKGATGTEGGFTDKLKGAANQAGADSIKGGAIGTIAGAAGDAVAGVGADAAAAEVDGATPSAAAEPYQPEPMDQTSDYGGNPEDYSAGGQYDMETPEIGGTSGGFDPETGESNMDMSDEEAAAFNAQQDALDAQDANGETPGVDYQEPTATSAAEAEAGVGTIDPVTGKEIEVIDPENKPGFFKKLGSLLPGGTKPREVFGKYTGKG